LLVPRLSSSGFRDEYDRLNEAIFRGSWAEAKDAVNQLEYIIDTYFSSRGREKSEFNKQIQYVRGAVSSGRREMAVENLRKLVVMLKKDGRRMDPRDRLNELRLELEQALSESDAGEIGKDEAAATMRDVLDDMVRLKRRFKDAESDYPGIYSAYAKAMEAAGGLRARLHNIVSKSRGGASDDKALQAFEERIDAVVGYEPGLVEFEEEGEGMTPTDLITTGLEMMMKKGKAEAVQEVLNKVVQESGMGEGEEGSGGGAVMLQSKEQAEEFLERQNEERE